MKFSRHGCCALMSASAWKNKSITSTASFRWKDRSRVAVAAAADRFAAFRSSSQATESEDFFSTDYHAPVMWRECVDFLLLCRRAQQRQRQGTNDTSTASRLVFVDGTLGGGGHSAALLSRLESGDVVFGCDVDPDALKAASARLSEYMVPANNHDKPLFVPVASNFCNLVSAIPQQVHPETGEVIVKDGVDGILLDLGVSSHQIDTPERGFAFMKDGPLDMRMGDGPLTAANICNEFDVKEIQRILKVYGDEPRSKSIAAAIVQRRPLRTTNDLVDAVATVTPQFAKKGRRMGRMATLARVFQSLRITVNQEAEVLEKALSSMAPSLLRPGGMLVVLAYHSMEDRMAKRIMRDGSLTKDRRLDERDIYGNRIGLPMPFRPLGKYKASEYEININPRARSATLRVGERQG